MVTPEEAAAAVEKAKADLAAAESAHAQAKADAPPREPNVILADFMAKIASRFGGHHELEALVTEFGKATAPKTE